MYGKFERKKRLTSIVDLLFKEFPLNEFESHLGPGEHSLGTKFAYVTKLLAWTLKCQSISRMNRSLPTFDLSIFSGPVFFISGSVCYFSSNVNT